MDNVTFIQKAKNIFSRLIQKNPKSVIDIAATMEVADPADFGDNDIEGMGQQFSSSSSSSDDELPEFLQQRQLNVQFNPTGTVKMLSRDGKVMNEVSQEQFLRENPQFAQFRPQVQPQPAGFNPAAAPANGQIGQAQFPPNQFPQPMAAQVEQPQSQLPQPDLVQQPVNVMVQSEGEGEFSQKYKERLEKEKQRKGTEPTTPDNQDEETLDENEDSNEEL